MCAGVCGDELVQGGGVHTSEVPVSVLVCGGACVCVLMHVQGVSLRVRGMCCGCVSLCGAASLCVCPCLYVLAHMRVAMCVPTCKDVSTCRGRLRSGAHVLWVGVPTCGCGAVPHVFPGAPVVPRH